MNHSFLYKICSSCFLHIAEIICLYEMTHIKKVYTCMEKEVKQEFRRC